MRMQIKLKKETIPWAMAAGRSWPRLVRNGLAVVLCALTTASAYAVGRGEAEYTGGSANVTRGAVGSFDTTSPTTLRFQYKNASGAAGQLDMEYEKIYGVEPSQQTVHTLGLLPWIAVSLVAHPQRRYLLTVRYADAQGTAQIAVFEVTRRDQPIMVAILNARTSRGCGARTSPCAAALERR
jgi:hypothetical protein